ncbi:CBS domain-containing protein [Aliiroseovarius sp.]|uniref:CBS domain-containing protein n=1 Tax=Aliiroseovarius sp. TaxID=1872442 RepID=UPI003BAA2A85
MSTTTLRKILGDRPVHTVSPEATLRAVAGVMEANRVGAVAVVEGRALKGIVTERDIVFRAVAQGMDMAATQASAVMTADPVTVGIDDAVSDALAAKLGDAFRHLPVMEGDQLVGLLSYRDIPAEYVMLFERFREMSTARADG